MRGRPDRRAAVFAGFDPSDTERALAQLRHARVTLGELHDAAPGEVRDDIEVEIAYVQALIDGLGGARRIPNRAESVEVVRDGHGRAPRSGRRRPATWPRYSAESCTLADPVLRSAATSERFSRTWSMMP